MLKVIGNHEKNTIDQAQKCLDMGADKFVLCADGHLGYGHPIGGVAAYKNKISISGVCFAIQTKKRPSFLLSVPSSFTLP